MADSARERKEADDRLANHMREQEELRIAHQHAVNDERRNQRISNISTHQRQIFDSNLNSRDHLNTFLKSNYDNFFKEKLADHAKKQNNASDMYNYRQECMRQARNNQAQDYARTTMSNVAVMKQNESMKQDTEKAIKQLEEEEMRMLNTMQATLKKKEQAIETLKSKSSALKNGIEPRNAYKLG